MVKAIIVSISVLAACFFGASVVNGSELCDIASSTARIIHALCHANGGANQKNQAVIDGFFKCYDDIQGKDIFERCQVAAFGAVLDTTAGVTASCRSRLPLLKYGPCLSSGFKAAGINMNAQVLKLNECQSKVLGVPFPRGKCGL